MTKKFLRMAILWWWLRISVFGGTLWWGITWLCGLPLIFMWVYAPIAILVWGGAAGWMHGNACMVYFNSDGTEKSERDKNIASLSLNSNTPI